MGGRGEAGGNRSGSLDSFRRSPWIAGGRAILGAWFDEDACPGHADCNSGPAYISSLESEFQRGDCSGDGASEITAAVLGLQGLSAPASSVPTCLSACDAKHDGSFSIGDRMRMLGRLFARGTPKLADATGVCRGDSTPDDLMSAELLVCPSGPWRHAPSRRSFL